MREPGAIDDFRATMYTVRGERSKLRRAKGEPLRRPFHRQTYDDTISPARDFSRQAAEASNYFTS